MTNLFGIISGFSGIFKTQNSHNKEINLSYNHCIGIKPHNMFQNMIENIKEDSVKFLYRVEIKHRTDIPEERSKNYTVEGNVTGKKESPNNFNRKLTGKDNKKTKIGRNFVVIKEAYLHPEEKILLEKNIGRKHEKIPKNSIIKKSRL